jgi:hypothetical protein
MCVLNIQGKLTECISLSQAVHINLLQLGHHCISSEVLQASHLGIREINLNKD